ncbi:wax ester/triacylglycerol synthase domain-containing protein [Nocardia sp. NPDC050712]|uniref:wax ester/triacylglycerol synthase domain-containing protein n=1 Tax=Nocardia sp. NPDC050712 TaxID=3155518 RepID=UPI0033CE7721
MVDRVKHRRRMAAQDATMYWLSERTRNDLFLLYGFTDTGVPAADLRAHVERRSAAIPDLRVRLRTVPRDLDYPSWEPCGFSAGQIIEHELPQADWAHLQAALGELLGTGVDATHRPWRLHVFRGVAAVPGGAEPATVVVLQLSHALADGKRATAIARSLFGPEEPAGPVRHAAPELPDALRIMMGALRIPVQIAATMARGYQAFRAQRALAELTDSGRLPAPGPSYAPSLVNRQDGAADPTHQARMLVRNSGELSIPGRTVTVVVLTAVSVALPDYLKSLGMPVEQSGAQVPMALPGKTLSHNNYRSLGVDLHLDEPDLRRRAEKIGAALADRRIRGAHPLLSVQDRVTAVTPAIFLRRDIDRFQLDTVPDAIAGHTVVSSVHRGPADLFFGGPVRFTGGFPAIGSVMHLTHGVHGLGGTVTISVHADPAAVPDIEVYLEFLDTALREVRAAHDA